RLVRQGQRTAGPDPIDPHRPRDILELLLTCVLESDLQLALSVLLNPARHTDASRFSNTLKTRRHVHAFAEDVAAVDHDIPNIDPDAELNPLVLRNLGIALHHPPLNLDCTPRGIHHAGELHQYAVSSGLDDPAAVLGDLGL